MADSGSRGRILIVDDDEDLCELAAFFFERAGYAVSVALDGEAGLEQAKSSKPDLVLLDLAMPRMIGFEVVKRIRETPGLSGTRVIVSSSKNFPVDKKAVLDLGADAFVPKPYKLEELETRVRELLAAARPQAHA